MNISLVHRADIQDLEVWMSADEGKVSKSRPQMQGDQSIPIDSVKFRVVAPVKRDLLRIVYPESRVILARNVAKAAKAVVRVVLV
jgi:hypothetical protein